MARPRCYVASPLGFTEAGRYYYTEVYLPELRRVVEVVDPWSLISRGGPSGAAPEHGAREIALEIGRLNIEAIRSSSLLVAHLDGQEPDSGTVAELGFAAGLGIPCFGLRSDLRRAGEPGMAVNLQVEGFVLASRGRLVGSLDELITALSDYVGGCP